VSKKLRCQVGENQQFTWRRKAGKLQQLERQRKRPASR